MTLEPQDLRGAAAALAELRVTPDTPPEDSLSSLHRLGRFNQCLLGLVRFSGLTPWERHPDGDELLQVLDGAVDVTLLTDDGTVERTLASGSVFIVPSGLWHRQRPHAAVTLMFATPSQNTEHSWTEDPRRS